MLGCLGGPSVITEVPVRVRVREGDVMMEAEVERCGEGPPSRGMQEPPEAGNDVEIDSRPPPPGASRRGHPVDALILDSRLFIWTFELQKHEITCCFKSQND